MFKKTTYPLNFKILMVLFLWWFFKFFYDFLSGVDGLSFQAHKICIEWVQNKSTYDFLNLKILCSYNATINDPQIYNQIYDVFKSLGLVHLLVASGTHLLIINKGAHYFVQIWTKSKTAVFIFLGVFILCSNFSGPVTRCFVQITMSEKSKAHSLGLSPVNLTVGSSLIYLCFFPAQVETLSFWLSVTASLILALFRHSLLQLSLAFYILLLPFLADFSIPQTSSVLANIIITPMLAPSLILNSALYIFIPNYALVGDGVIENTLKGLEFFLISPNPNYSNPLKIKTTFKIYYGASFLLLALSLQNLKSKKLFSTLHKKLVL